MAASPRRSTALMAGPVNREWPRTSSSTPDSPRLVRQCERVIRASRITPITVSSALVRMNRNRLRRASRAVGRTPDETMGRVLSSIKFRRRDRRSLMTGPSSEDGAARIGPGVLPTVGSRRILFKLRSRAGRAPIAPRPSYRAEWNKAPSMYEMEGALPTSPHSVGQLPGLPGVACRPPGPGTRAKDQFPDSSHARGCPRIVPVSSGESISTAFLSVAQESAAVHFKFFLYPHNVHSTSAVIHRIMHSSSTGYLT